MSKVKQQSLILLPQITMRDLLVEIEERNLDVADLLRVAEPQLTYVPDMPNDSLTRLVRALLDVPVAEDAKVSEWLRAYDGLEEPWLEIIERLRLRGPAGASALAYPVARGYTATHQLLGGSDGSRWAKSSPITISSSRSEVLLPHSRTLGLELRRSPGGKGALQAPAPRPTYVADLDALAAAVAERVRPTVGGAAFLQPDPRGRALAVFAATVSAVLQHRSSQQLVGDVRFVRFDRYEQILEVLGLASFFEVARRFLEADHPEHVAIQGPWPPGVSNDLKSLAVLSGRDRLRLVPEARLPELPEVGMFRSLEEVAGC